MRAGAREGRAGLRGCREHPGGGRRAQPRSLRPPQRSRGSPLAESFQKRADRGKIAALEEATRAVEIEPQSAEAAFNLARIQESLSLWRRAGEGYAAASERDQSSEWGRQSDLRRAALAAFDSMGTAERVRSELRLAVEQANRAEIERLVSSHPQLSRELAQDELLIRWARDIEAAGSSKISPGLFLVGSALVGVSRDYTVADTLAGTALAARGDWIARRISAYGKALPYLEVFDYESARPMLLAAGASTGPSAIPEDPLLRWAGYYLSREAYQRSEYETAFPAMERLVRSPGSDRYPALLARVLRVQALIYRIRGDFPRARDKYLEAARLSHSAGELGAYADQQVSLALVLHALGDRNAAWRALDEALRLRGHLFHPVGQYRLLNAAAMVLRDQERPEAARWFQTEAIEIAEKSNNPTLLVEAYRELAAIEESAGNVEGALEALGKSSEHAADVSSPSVVRFLKLENHRRVGLVLLDVDPEAAVKRLSEAIEVSEEIGYGQVLPGLLLARAEIWQSLGRVKQIESDLLLAMRQLESQSEQISLPEYRISFSEQTQAVYERLMLFEWDRGESGRAFAAADRPRSRLLRDWLLNRSEASPDRPQSADRVNLTAERVVAALDERTALIEFSLVEDRALAWTFTAAGMRAHELSSTPEKLRDSVRRLHHSAEVGYYGAAERELAYLYDALIEPLALLKPQLTQLIVVPDDDLARVPFSSLLDRRWGRRLIDKVAVTISGSAAATAIAGSAPDVSGGVTTALIIADPSFDPIAYPELPRLEHSLQEAAKVNRVYGPGSRVLSGKEATRGAFIENAGRYDVVHIASHAVTTTTDPLTTSLVMAESPGEPAALSARDVLGINLRGVRLVVLSACGSVAGSASDNTGARSLSRAFLAAGAKAVVAAVWSIGDEEASDSMADLHRQLQRYPTVMAGFQAWKRRGNLQRPHAFYAEAAFELYTSE